MYIYLLIFSLLSLYIKTHSVISLDIELSRFIQAQIPSSLLILFKFISFPGYQIPAVLSIVLFSLFFQATKHYRESKAIFLVLLFDLIGAGIKIIVSRPRPTSDLVSIRSVMFDKSFPSNHVIHYVLLFGFILYLLNHQQLKFSSKIKKLIRLTSWFFILTVGLSRVYLGAHWPSDVLGGYLLGYFLLQVLIKTEKKFKTQTLDH